MRHKTHKLIVLEFFQIFFLILRNLKLIKKRMKFAEILWETVSQAENKNSISYFLLGSKYSRNLGNTANFPGWENGRPGELIW